MIAGLERISHIFRYSLWQTQNSYGLTPLQAQVLVFVLFHDESRNTATTLASEYSVSKATISDTISILVRKKLMKRVKSKEDARVDILTLTTKGEKAAKELSGFADGFRDQFASFSKKQKTEFYTLLVSFLKNLYDAKAVTSVRMCPTCEFFSGSSSGGSCSLLKVKLKDADLRIDCPVHVSKA